MLFLRGRVGVLLSRLRTRIGAGAKGISHRSAGGALDALGARARFRGRLIQWQIATALILLSVITPSPAFGRPSAPGLDVGYIAPSVAVVALEWSLANQGGATSARGDSARDSAAAAARALGSTTPKRSADSLGASGRSAPLVRAGAAAGAIAAAGTGDPSALMNVSMLLWILLVGAVGGFAAEIITHAGRIERPRRDETGVSLGTLGHMIVGAVAATIVMSVSPPGSDATLFSFIGKALAAGVGGEAILAAIVNAKRASDAITRQDVAEQRVVEVKGDAMDKLRHVETVALNEVDALSELASHTARALPRDTSSERGVRPGVELESVPSDESDGEGNLSGSRTRGARGAATSPTQALPRLIESARQRAHRNIVSASRASDRGLSATHVLPSGTDEPPPG